MIGNREPTHHDRLSLWDICNSSVEDMPSLLHDLSLLSRLLLNSVLDLLLLRWSSRTLLCFPVELLGIWTVTGPVA